MSQHPYRCPKCEGKGQWRRGVGFEHEMICMKCHVTWEPDEVHKINQTKVMDQSIKRTTVGKLIDALQAFGASPAEEVSIHGSSGVRLHRSEDSCLGTTHIQLTGDDHTKDNFLTSSSHHITITEEQRQATVMALAHLAVERPGWDHMLKEIASQMDNEGCPMYEEFKRLHADNVVDLDGDEGGVAQPG